MISQLCRLGARLFAFFALVLGTAASCGQSRLLPFITLDASISEQPSTDAPAETQPSDGAPPDAPADGLTVDGPIVTGCLPDELIGYATVPAATAGPATTGGGGGAVVTVKTFDALKAYAALPQQAVIRISANINATDPMLVVASDKTIEGLVQGDGLTGGGLDLSSSHNVIIRNLSIGLVKHPNDAIHLDNSQNIWIDHCDLFSNITNDPKGTYDGLVDIAHASDFVTVSWNKFHDHYLTSLVGNMASSGATDTGHLMVTYHHNWFHSAQSYDPRVRFGSVHVFNNLYDGNTNYEQGAAIVSTMYAHVLVEGNVFKNVRTPISTRASSDDTADGTVWDQTAAFPNIYNSGISDITMLEAWTSPPPYVYVPDPTGDVEGLVTSCAGQTLKIP